MKYFSTLVLLLHLSFTSFAQTIEVSDSFTRKLSDIGISFIEPKSGETVANNRSRTNSCEVNKNLEAQASYFVKKEKASFFVVYRIEAMNKYGMRYEKEDNMYANMAYNNAISTLSEKDFAEIISLSTPQITQALNADWVRISSFPLQKRWKDCFVRTHCYHIFAFKAGKGYCEIMLFFDEASREFMDTEIPNILTSIYFKKS